MTTLRSKLIRLAHQQPALRPHLLPILTRTAGSYPRIERELKDDYARKAITSGEYRELLSAIENAETEREAQKIVADHRKGRSASADMDPEAIYREALRNLVEIHETSDAVQEVIDGFNLHYASGRTAAVDPAIAKEFATLDQSRQALKLAETTVGSLEGIAKLYPTDKKYAKALADAAKMRDKLKVQVSASVKIIRTLSAKIAPKALQDMLKKVAAAIKDKLVDPSVLDVYINQLSDYKGIPYFAGIVKAPVGDNLANLWLREAPTGVPGVTMGMSLNASAGPYEWKPATVNGAVDLFLSATKGWANIKGETEGRAQREGTARAIASALDSVVGRMGWMSDKVTISTDFRTIDAGYRSDLPKEGAYEVGEYEYDRMVDEEIARAKKIVSPALARYQDKIQHVGYSSGEKSWIDITVTLK